MKSNKIVQTVLIAAAFVVLYWSTLKDLIGDWFIDPNFSHGFLIPFVAGYMVWYRQNQLRQLPCKSSISGVFIIIFGMMVYMAGNLGAELFLMRTSIIITLAGIITFSLGTAILKALIVPLCYLIMMIPIPAIIWNKIAFPLQLFAAGISSETISMIGIPVFREGNILHLANTSLEVVDACSGIRSLTSLLALTGAFSFLSHVCLWKKWVIFLSAIPIAVAVNVVRLTITGMLAAWVGPEAAHGFLHDLSGLIVFGTALILVYLLFIVLTKIGKKTLNTTDN
ncbi:exosortase [uncultured Desulfobacter sp.]|uniref:exosortase n=1 Tax=uncultured Desulfobacter sp. TaxID=240139 RepID=UPI002AAAFA0C|nr:exosortase [uncultured Desulfobacter sp.]